MDLFRSSHWIIYALLIWPLVSLAVTPFIGRFFNNSEQQNVGPYTLDEKAVRDQELPELAELPFSLHQPKT